MNKIAFLKEWRHFKAGQIVDTIPGGVADILVSRGIAEVAVPPVVQLQEEPEPELLEVINDGLAEMAEEQEEKPKKRKK
jgi:hypothetical protein